MTQVNMTVPANYNAAYPTRIEMEWVKDHYEVRIVEFDGSIIGIAILESNGVIEVTKR